MDWYRVLKTLHAERPSEFPDPPPDHGPSDLPWVRRLDEPGEMSLADLRVCYCFLRSTANMIGRSRLHIVSEDWQRVYFALNRLFSPELFASKLDVLKIIHSLQEMGVGPGVSYKERRIVLGLDRPSEVPTGAEVRMQSFMKGGAKCQRRVEWQYRLECAITEAVENGWFPLFGTYTVDPHRLPAECEGNRDRLWTDTPAWDRFVKRFKTEIADSLGMGRKPQKWAKTDTWFRYLAVIEHGKSGEHPHVHVVWLCKNIPASWKLDPNRANPNRDFRDIPGASCLWNWGTQRTTFPILIQGCWFVKPENGWMPIRDSETGEPVEVGTAAQVAGYVGKYLSKGEHKKWHHRTKATRNLGLSKVVQLIRQETSIQVLYGLSRRPRLYSHSQAMQLTTQAPLSLLRRISKTELLTRLHSSRTRQGKLLLLNSLTESKSEFFSNLRSNVLDGLRPWSMMPEQRYNLFSLILEGREASEGLSSGLCDTRIRDRLISWLDENLPRRPDSRAYVALQGGLYAD